MLECLAHNKNSGHFETLTKLYPEKKTHKKNLEKGKNTLHPQYTGRSRQLMGNNNVGKGVED